MELESLKYIWQQQETPPAREPDREEWRALLQKKSEGPVSRMRRNLRKEAIVLFLSYMPVILLYWFDFDRRLTAISWTYVGLLAVFGIYFYSKDRLLRKMLCVSCEVRSNLQRQVTALKKLVRIYLWFGTLMVPAVFIFMYRLIHREYPTKGVRLFYGSGHHPYWWANSTLWLVLLGVFTIGLYFLNTWYVNRLYGQHIKKLQDLLQEMDAE